VDSIETKGSANCLDTLHGINVTTGSAYCPSVWEISGISQLFTAAHISTTAGGPFPLDEKAA
jgi:hypothetical protein